MYVPAGHTTVFPYFVADDAEREIAFLVDGLGGREVGRTVAPDGRVVNARIRFGDTTVMVSQATEAWPALPSATYLYVEDADAAMARALAAGGTSRLSVDDRPYGERQGGVASPGGAIWWLSQRLSDAPYDDGPDDGGPDDRGADRS